MAASPYSPWTSPADPGLLFPLPPLQHHEKYRLSGLPPVSLCLFFPLCLRVLMVLLRHDLRLLYYHDL
jgi:hypothetical protein